MIVIQDSQEKLPFDFTFYDEIESVIVKKIPTGDYTIEGLEDSLCIERKASVDEIANNFGKKSGAWWREMQRMSKFDYKYIVCEFPFDHVSTYPKSSRVPQKKQIKMSTMLLNKSINDCVLKYGIEFIFCDSKSHAEDTVYNIFKKVIKLKEEESF